MNATPTTPAQTSYSESAERIRSFFAYVPKGARYYLTTFDTAGLDTPPEATKYALDAVCRELRAAAKDKSVDVITVLMMYDGPRDGENRTPPQQFLLQPLPMETKP